MSEPSSYRQILKSTSIIGGAHGLNYLVRLVRVKIVAVLLGPSGVGLVSLYSSLIELIGTISALGVNASGVRQVAIAYREGDTLKAARTVRILRRMCWATGFLGWILAAALSYPLSQWVLGSTDHAIAIAVLGATLLAGAVSGGQSALLQGLRRIGDLARVSVISMLANTVAMICLYAWLREKGIVLVMLATSLISLVISWWYSRRIEIVSVELNWRDTWIGARGLAKLGIALMWSGLLTAALDMVTRSIITREFSLDAAGLYQAAWAISGMFAGFILGAMGTDFYPRLTSVIEDHDLASRIVNEQTEIGVFLALPGLLVTLAFAPWFMELLYSEQFIAGAELLPWFLLGIFGRIVSWPLGYIQLAKGAARLYAGTETVFLFLQLGLVIWLVPRFGIVGAAYSFALVYTLYTIGMLRVGLALIGFRWSNDVKRLLLLSGLLVLVGFGARIVLAGWEAMLVGSVVALAAMLLSIRGLIIRLGFDHGLIKICQKLPGGKWIVEVMSK